MSFIISKFSFILFTLFTLGGCVTTKYLEQMQLPISIDSRFKVCGDSDGANMIEYLDERGPLGSLNIEWVYSKNQNLIIEGVSPIGQPIAQLSYASNSHKVSIDSRVKALSEAKISATSDGFVEIDGYFVPILYSEIPCLLDSAWPKTWLRNVTKSHPVDKERWRIVYHDESRDIAMSLYQKDSEVQRDCSKLSWSTMLFWNNEIRICIHPKKSGEIYFDSTPRLSWQTMKDVP